MFNFKNLSEEDIKNRNVFLRADLDVPLKKEDGETKIADSTRLKAWLPTLELILKNQGNLTIGGHLGRPKQQISFLDSKSSISNIDKEFSLQPVAEWLKHKLELQNKLTLCQKNGFYGWELTGNLFFLENLRFYKEEEENNLEFAKKLAKGFDIYVNDAFASCHRANTSIAAMPTFLQHFAGLRLKEEVKVLSSVLENPKRPLTVVIGGAKVETKLPVVSKMVDIADCILVGGEIAAHATTILDTYKEYQGGKTTLLIADLIPSGKEITEQSIDKFLPKIYASRTVVWNGPMGFFEGGFEKATLELANAIIKSDAYSVIGGGDTLSFLKKHNLLDKFSFASTGGGAMLDFLAGQKMPGLEALV
jgi:phosphoglycerate kinase